MATDAKDFPEHMEKNIISLFGPKPRLLSVFK